jgi:hypothetical protein
MNEMYDMYAETAGNYGSRKYERQKARSKTE